MCMHCAVAATWSHALACQVSCVSLPNVYPFVSLIPSHLLCRLLRQSAHSYYSCAKPITLFSHPPSWTTPGSTAAFPITLFNGLSQSPPGNTQSRCVHSAHRNLPQHSNRCVSRLFTHVLDLYFTFSWTFILPVCLCLVASEKELHGCHSTLCCEFSLCHPSQALGLHPSIDPASYSGRMRPLIIDLPNSCFPTRSLLTY